MLTQKLAETTIVVVLLITAVIVFFYGARQQQKRLLLMGGGSLLALLGVVVLWGLWVIPPQTPAPSEEAIAAQQRASLTALPTDTPLQIIEKMGCAVCHKIPRVPHATVGVNGPILMLGTTAPLRLASAEYRARVKAGRAHATTAKEYVMESIVDPQAFIVPGFDSRTAPTVIPMYPHYRERFQGGALDILALFLLSINEEMARQDGLLQ